MKDFMKSFKKFIDNNILPKNPFTQIDKNLNNPISEEPSENNRNSENANNNKEANESKIKRRVEDFRKFPNLQLPAP